MADNMIHKVSRHLEYLRTRVEPHKSIWRAQCHYRKWKYGGKKEQQVQDVSRPYQVPITKRKARMLQVPKEMGAAINKAKAQIKQSLVSGPSADDAALLSTIALTHDARFAGLRDPNATRERWADIIKMWPHLTYGPLLLFDWIQFRSKHQFKYLDLSDFCGKLSMLILFLLRMFMQDSGLNVDLAKHISSGEDDIDEDDEDRPIEIKHANFSDIFPQASAFLVDSKLQQLQLEHLEQDINGLRSHVSESYLSTLLDEILDYHEPAIPNKMSTWYSGTRAELAEIAWSDLLRWIQYLHKKSRGLHQVTKNTRAFMPQQGNREHLRPLIVISTEEAIGYGQYSSYHIAFDGKVFLSVDSCISAVTFYMAVGELAEAKFGLTSLIELVNESIFSRMCSKGKGNVSNQYLKLKARINAAICNGDREHLLKLFRQTSVYTSWARSP